MDLAITTSRSRAQHEAECPEIGPQCLQGAVAPQHHDTVLWVTEIDLLAEAGIAPGWGLQGVLPLRLVNTRTRITDLASGAPVPGGSIHHRDGTLFGPGDAQILLHHAHSALGLRLGERFGVSVPLGAVHQDPYLLGEAGLPHQHVQFGTGTLDPVASLDVALDLGAVSLAGYVQAQVPLYQGGQGYRAGARVFGGVQASRPVGPLRLRLGVNVLHEEAERWRGAVPVEDGNRGRTDLYVSPGATIPFANDWSISLDVRVRAASRVVGAQLEMPVVLQLSVGRLAHLERNADQAHGADASGDVRDVVSAGEEATLAPVPGKLTVFDFWAAWCDACRTVDAGLRSLAAEHSGIAVRRVNIVDLDSPIARRELPGVSVLPHVRVVDPSGAVLYEASGPADELLREVRRRTAER
jgi:thiol-disulfide isomerase/thioredoxin